MTSKITSFFSEVGKWSKKLFGSTTWEKQVSSVISYVAPILETVLALVAGGPTATAVGAVVSQIQNDLATLGAVVSTAQANGTGTPYQTAQSILNSIKTNASQILAAADIKDTAKQQQITALINGFVAEIDAALTALPATA